MPNHWHLVVWPESDSDLSAFMQQMTNMHVKRWKEHRHETGFGHLYQGRYKSFPVETEGYFYQLVRYVERNALRANLVARAEEWTWSSLRRAEREDPAFPILSAWPVARPSDWLEIVNGPQSEAELASLRRCVQRGCPLGDAEWAMETAKQMHIESTLRPPREAEERELNPKRRSCLCYLSPLNLVAVTFSSPQQSRLNRLTQPDLVGEDRSPR